MKRLRPELPPLPDTMKHLPVSRGYPVPWFVANTNAIDPDFRIADRPKFRRALAKKLCWVCGTPIPALVAFVIGPMCVVNRVSAEPPSHPECALFSVKACPFLTRPHMARRDDAPEGTTPAPGYMELRNPGVTILWQTRAFEVFSIPGGLLLNIGVPEDVTPYCQGRLATADELRTSIESGMPALRTAAERDGLDGLATLAAQRREAYKLLGLEVPR